MKVLMISKALVVAAYHGKLREMSKLGVELTVAVPERWKGQALEPTSPDGFALRVLPCRLSGSYHFHFYPEIRNLIGERNWDIVHMDEDPFNFVSYHTSGACRGSGKQFLFFTWQNILKRYPPPFNFFERRVFKNSSGAIAGNEEAVSILRRRGFSKLLSVIPQFGVDPSVFRKQDSSDIRRKVKLNGRFTVGYIGRMVREKGLDTLVRALAFLPSDVCLLLVGTGPYRAGLQRLVGELDLQERVRWAPWIRSSEIAEYMNAIDVLVLPSLTVPQWKEQFGRVLVEAMACETCVVGSDSGEIPNVIGDAGLVFHEGDEKELAARLVALMNSPTVRETLRTKGRQRVLDLFTHAKVARDTVGFYKRLCAEDS